MCGIAGFFNPRINFSDTPKKTISILNQMISSMKMRGPNEQNFSIIDSCCLAHTRLSIIDINGGSQPMTVYHNENKYHVIYNGEIYNYKEIRNELISRGYKFNTNSDTEVIGVAFIHWGEEFVNKLNGIFAIAIFDQSNQTLYLYRDRFGIKPLYYTQSCKTLVFASRIDTLFEYPKVKPCIDINGFNEIFTVGPAKTPGQGVFLGIREVLPGEVIIYSQNSFTKKLYYQLKSTPHYDTPEETLEKTKWLIEDSIRMQLISDVPICTFLSGGIDSSLVTSICCKHSKEKPHTYSFDFEDNNIHFKANSFQPSEDRPYVDIMKDFLETDHTYLNCKYEILADLLEESVDSRGLPTMADVDSSLLYFCSEVAKNHRVALTGECADEIFGGYPWFHKEEMMQDQTFPWMKDISFRKSILNSEFAAALHMEAYISQKYNKTISEVQILPEESKKEATLRKISYLNIRWFMQTLLDRMDRTSMHSGLEARVPFADHRLIEYVYNVPWKIKVADNTPKSLLRKAAKDFLPESIMNRPKSPYPKTYHPEYEDILINRLNEIINDTSSPIRSYLNIPVLESFLKSPKEYGKPWYGQLMAGPQMIAYLIQINYWMRKYSLSV